MTVFLHFKFAYIFFFHSILNISLEILIRYLFFCDSSTWLYIWMHLYNFNPFQILEEVYGWFNSLDPKVWDPRSKHLPA